MTGVLLRDIMRGYSKSLLERLPPSTSHKADKNFEQVNKKRMKKTEDWFPQIVKNVSQAKKKQKRKTENASKQVDKNVPQVLKKTGKASPRKDADDSKRIKQVKSSATIVLADNDKEDKANESRKRKLKRVVKSDVFSTSKHTKIKKPNHLPASSASDTNKEKTHREVISPAGAGYSVDTEEIKRKIMIARLVHSKKKMVGASKMNSKQDVFSIAPVSDTVSLKLKELSKTLCPMKSIIQLTDYACKSTTQTLLSPLDTESHNAVALKARPSLPKAKPRKSVATKPVPTSSKGVTRCVPMVVLPQLEITPPETPPNISSATPTMRSPPRLTSIVPPVTLIPLGLIPKLENISPVSSCDGDEPPVVPRIMVPLVKRMLSLSAPNTPDPAVTVESSACALVSVSEENNSTHPIPARNRSRVKSLLPSIVKSNVSPCALPSVTVNVREIIASDRKSSHARKSLASASSRTRSTQKTPRMIRAAERAVNRFSPTMCSKPRVVRKTVDCGRRSGLLEATSVPSTLAPVTEVITASPMSSPAFEKLLNVLYDERKKKVEDLNTSSNDQTSSSVCRSREDRCTGTIASNQPGSMQNESDVEPQRETDSFGVGAEATTNGLRRSSRPLAIQSLPGGTSRVVAVKAVKRPRMRIDRDLRKQGHNKRKVVLKSRPIARINRVPKKKSKKSTALESVARNRNNTIETETDEVTRNSKNEIIKKLLGSVSGDCRKKRKKWSRVGIANCCWLCGSWKVKLRLHLRSKHADAFVRRKERDLSPEVKDRLVRKRTKQCYDTAIMLRRVQRYPFSKSVLRQRYDQAEWEKCEESVLRSTEALGFKVMSSAGAWRWKAIAGRKVGNYDFFVED